MEVSVLLSRIRPFQDLSREELERIAGTFRSVDYPRGEKIIRQGDLIKEIGIVGSGRVLLAVHRPGGDPVSCGTLGRGDVLVDPGLMSSGRFVISAYSETPVVCHVQALKDYWAMVEAYPPIKDFFYERAMTQLTTTLETAINALAADPRCKEEGADSLLFHRSVRKALLYIHENYMNSVTLDVVAQINGMSKFHFSRVFKEKTGLTFKQYLNKCRIEMAKYLMKHKEMNVSEAAFAVGYNDLAYFTRVFQKQEGILPSRYRKGLEMPDRDKNHNSPSPTTPLE